jgi:uncharacterized protein (DUF302 family)
VTDKGFTMIKIISRTIFVLVVFNFVSSSVLASDSLISIESGYSVKQTADRFEAVLKKKGLTIFARIDHSSNASTVGLELGPTELIIFGNPKVGTPLMQCSKQVAIDLPQKALFWSDVNGQTWLSFNNPEYLKERHDIKGCDSVIQKISSVLDNLSKAAVAK